MPTLSARYVRQPRARWYCDWCGRAIDGPYIRLYGNSDHEPMQTLRLHPVDPCCLPAWDDPKIATALAKASEP